MKTQTKNFLRPSLLFLLLPLFSFCFFTPSSFAENNLTIPSDQTVEELLDSARLSPLGATENSEKVKSQKEANNLLTIICLIVMGASGLGVILILLHPLFHRRKKKPLIKF